MSIPLAFRSFEGSINTNGKYRMFKRDHWGVTIFTKAINSTHICFKLHTAAESSKDTEVVIQPNTKIIRAETVD